MKDVITVLGIIFLGLFLLTGCTTRAIAADVTVVGDGMYCTGTLTCNNTPNPPPTPPVPPPVPPVTPPAPPTINVSKLSVADPNMRNGAAIGTQTVAGENYYKFELPNHCNRVTVAWTTFDWVGKVDMMVKAGSLPTIADWNNALSKGYPAHSLVSPVWYSLMQSSGDGGETITMANVPAGTYYIMMKNTNSASSLFKVWYTTNCTYSGR